MENLTSNIEEVLNQDTILKLELDLILPCIPADLKTRLTEAEIEKVGYLFSEGFICLNWNDNNVQEVCFTLLGKLEVFKIKYSDEISYFKKHLINYGYNYDSAVIDGFLLNLDLSKTPEELLTFDNFENYWAIYNQYFENKHF